ncbi:MAG: hypothetical protein RLZZ398_1782 [Verrucomicrobiota bacterium]|jgi:uncharacterized repeat protein (TIGR03803 family)
MFTNPVKYVGLLAMPLSLAVLSVCGLLAGGVHADPVHEVVAAFAKPLSGPSRALVVGADGFLWGYAQEGGTAGIGVIYKIRPDGTGFTKVVNQIVNSPMILGPNGDLYGLTYSGGADSHGSVIKINTAGLVTTVFSFNDFDPARKGRGPSSLVLGSDGNFYGTTAIGGVNGGTTFKLTPAGVFTSLSQFTVAVQGYEPNSLIQGSDGSFYGTTVSGGIDASGTIFKMTPDGTRTLLASFTGGSTGELRGAGLNGLEEAGDGNFYGVTRSGGANGYGTIFRITSGGAMTTLKDFTGSSGLVPGAGYRGGLRRASDGALYGTIESGAVGSGEIYKITTAGVFSVVANFQSPVTGQFPFGTLTLGPGGHLYGTTIQDSLSGWDLSSGSLTVFGTVFRVTTAGVITTLTNFNDTSDAPKGFNPNGGLVRAADGNFYGVTYAGGAKRRGTVFRMTPTGTITTLVEFTDTVGPKLGAYPRSGLIIGGNGRLFGTTDSGGIGIAGGVGTLFSLALDGSGFTTHVNFGYATAGGRYPNSLMLASDGNIYGTTFRGGTGGYGTFFKWSAAGAFTQMFSFAGTAGLYKGNNPSGSLAEAPDGLIYGTTRLGGSSANQGSIYTTSTAGAFTTLYTFNSSAMPFSGFTPNGLIRASDGSFYGPTLDGANAAGAGLLRGTLYKISAAGALTTLYDATNVTALRPYSSLVEGPDGNFYGTSQGGTGSTAGGNVFKMTPAGGVSTLVSFSGLGSQLSSGSSPVDGALVFGVDGKLYGATNYGGPAGGGTVYRVSLNSIALQYPVRTTLTDAVSTVDFGAGPLNNTSNRIFTILNTGNTTLTGFPITFTGPQAANYRVSVLPPVTTLAPGASTTFTVEITYGGTGNRRAVMHMGSDAPGDLASYQVNLTGRGPLTAINEAPTFLPPSFATRAGLTAVIPLSQLLAAVSEPNGDNVFLNALSWASTLGGTVAYAGGNITFTPAFGASGTDGFSITFDDGRGATVTGTVNLQVVSPALDVVTGASLTTAGGAAAFSASGIPGLGYLLQTNTDLTGAWTTQFGIIVAASDGTISVTDNAPVTGSKFYRLVAP